MRYGKDFWIGGRFTANTGRNEILNSNYVVVYENLPEIDKAKCFKSEKEAIKFYKTCKNRFKRAYEVHDMSLYEVYHDNLTNSFDCDYKNVKTLSVDD